MKIPDCTIFGGFPEYLKSGNADNLRSLIDDVLYRDIVVRYNIRDVSSLKRLLSYLLFNAEKLTTPSKLKDAVGVKSPTTVLDYFSHLRRHTRELFYYNENNSECDFVELEQGKVKHLFQVCWDLNADNEDREINGLIGAMHYFNQTKGTIITANQKDMIYRNNYEIEVVPAWIFLK